MWSLAVAAALIGASTLWQPVSWFFMLGLLVLLGGSAMMIKAIGHVLRTRYVVYRWATAHGHQRPLQLWLGPEGYRVVDRDSEQLVRWSAITRAYIEKDHIRLSDTEDRIFLRRSMREADFEALCDTIRDRLPNASQHDG
jgi:hypothetical protein